MSELLDAESVAGHLVGPGSMFALLAEHRRVLFPGAMFADLFPTGRGRPSIPVDIAASIVVLQALFGLSDRETMVAVRTDLRWKVACGLPVGHGGFDASTLTYWRRRLAASDRRKRIFEVVGTVVAETGVLRGKTRRALDSTVLDDAVATQDTITQLIAVIRKVAREVPGADLGAGERAGRGAAPHPQADRDRLSVVSRDDEESVDQFIIYAGYGEVMHRLQVLELSLWIIQSRSIKPHTRLDQAMAKVEKWNGTTLGELMRGMRTQRHWPDGLVDELLKAVDIRNYLAHHYLREYFVIAPSAANRERSAQELADLSVWVEELIDELDAHVRSLGIASTDELDEQMAGEIDALRPAEWLGMPDRP